MVKVTAKLNAKQNKRCPMCHDDIDGKQLYCQHLSSLVHTECMAEFGRCECVRGLSNEKLVIDLGTQVFPPARHSLSGGAWGAYSIRAISRLTRWWVVLHYSPSYWFTAALAAAELLEYVYRKK